MKNITTDWSSIDKLVNAGCVYVDKTAYLHRLITSASKLYFILRRVTDFGKSGIHLRKAFYGERIPESHSDLIPNKEVCIAFDELHRKKFVASTNLL